MAHDIITKFHSIEGVSYGERRKNLYTFFKDVSATPEAKQILMDNLKPKSYLESIFFIDLLIHLRETTRLLEIFYEGNGAFVSKIMKHPWFFQEAFGNIVPDRLVDDILPSLSFSVKINFLRNLYHIYTEEKIDQVFDLVVDRYGLIVATTFITLCSTEKIANVLKNNKVKLSTPQLKIIFRKQSSLISIYLEEQEQYFKKKQPRTKKRYYYNSEHDDGNIFNKNFLKYLAQRDPTYFWELMDKFKINNFKLGRRTTKKVIVPKRQEIIADPNKYVQYLKQDTLVRKLNNERVFKQFYYNIFPRTISTLENGYSLWYSILKSYPKNGRYNLFTQTFNDVMKEDIWQYKSCIHDDILRYIPDKELRQTWGQLKYKETGNDDYLKLFEVKVSIPLIKTKINTTSSIKTRKTLITLLVKSCALNKDLEALEEVLRYFCERHKNDDKFIRHEFLLKIQNNFNSDEFNDTHWKYIHEVLTVQSLNKENFGYDVFLRVRHIEYLFRSNASQEARTECILEYLKDQMIQDYCMNFTALYNSKNTDAKKSILLHAIEYIDTLIKTHHKEQHETYYKNQVLLTVLWFNENHPDNLIKIEESEMLIQHLKDITKGTEFVSYHFEKYISKMVLKLNRSEIENHAVGFFFGKKSFTLNYHERVLVWFLKHDPMVVIDHFESIVQNLPTKKKRTWSLFKMYNHLSLDNKIVKHCKHKLSDDKLENKSEFVEPLSVLLNAEQYIKIMEDLNLIPISSKIISDNADSRKVYDVQKAFITNFKNVSNPLEYLPLLIDKFCKGDYLQKALTPLNSAFYKIPENKLYTYLDRLANNKSVSVKKHGLLLASYMFDEGKVSQIFTEFEGNKNVSLQKSMCLFCLRYFTQNQKQEFFDKLLSYMNFLKAHDTESLKILITVPFPKKYKPEYIINLWNLLEELKMEENAAGFNTLLSDFLENIDTESIANLPQDFCRSVIDKYFETGSKNEDGVAGIFKFTINFLLYHGDQVENLMYVFALLSNYKTQFWDKKGEARNVFHKFFNAFYHVANKEDVELDFVTRFSEEWNKIFTSNETFNQYVILHLLKFKKEARNNFELYSKLIVHFAEQINDKYGEFIFSKFIPIVAKYGFFRDDEKEIIELMTSILKYKTSPLICIFVIELIKRKGDILYKNAVSPVYKEIDSILKEVTDPKVRLCYNYDFYSKNE